jgi:type IV secretory pathway VirB10-like protein
MTGHDASTPPPPAWPEVFESAAGPVPPPPTPLPQISAIQIEPAFPSPPPGPELMDLVLAADSVVGLRVESGISSDTARVEDTVIARVTRDVKVGDHVAIPAGSQARGEVILVERGGRLREQARLGVRFTSILLADGTYVPIAAEAIYREGESPGRESASKIGGGAIGGAIIGGLIGGAKGAAIGGSIGAGAGTAAVATGGRNPATLAAGSAVTIRLQEAAAVTIEQ